MTPERPLTVFLDRDGTINVDTGYVHDAATVRLLPNAAEGLAALSKAGARLVVISNQSGVGRGYFARERVDEVNAAIGEQLAAAGARIDGWYWCPHSPEDACECRKPATRLFQQASEKLGIDLTGDTWMIGDKLSDLRGGRAIDARTILVATGEGAASHAKPDAAELLDAYCEDLAAAAETILASR